MRSEFGFLEDLQRKYRLNRIGDDCAVLPKDARTDLVVTTDLLVEDIDFRLAWTRPELLGHKALAVSLSDVAAMGARPVWAMLSLGVPEAIWRTDFVDRFYEGWFALASQYGVELVGGDVSRTPDRIVVDSIAAGEVERGEAILRSGARPGDLICVSGELGGAAAGLQLLEAGESPGLAIHENLILRQLRPNPRIELARFIRRNRLAGAMIDVSDGLSSDLRHLCRASGVGAALFAERIPVDRHLPAGYFHRREDSPIEDPEPDFAISPALALALDGGEDFELLFTVSPKKISGLEKPPPEQSFSVIGEVTANAEIVELTSNKKARVLTPKGFRHF